MQQTFYSARAAKSGSKKNAVRAAAAAALLFVLAPGLSWAQPTYCPATHSNTCAAASNINGVEITGTTLNNQGTGCTSGVSNAYTVYPATGNTTASLIIGQTYSFVINPNGNLILSIWIDFNQNGTFEASEHTQPATTTTTGTLVTSSITIPLTATPGATGLRVRSRLNGNPNGPGDACLSMASGESEDYTITLVPATPCAGTPTVGAVTANPATACYNGTTVLSASGISLASGLTYQWQQGASSTGPFTNVTGGTTPSYTTAPLTTATFYRLLVTCTASSQTATSAATQVTVGATPCYCTTGLHTSNCTATNHINSVVLTGTGLNNTGTGCNGTTTSPGYVAFPPSANTTATLIAGQTYTLNVTTGNAARISVWIDYNRNGDFEPSEWTQVATASTANTPSSVQITVPVTVSPGLTGMRIRSRASTGVNDATSSCLAMTAGETEDYTITLDPGTPCAGTPTAGTPSGTLLATCSGGTVSLSVSGATMGQGVTYQWEESDDNGVTDPWGPVVGGSGANLLFYTSPALTDTIFYRLKVTCANSGQVANTAPVKVDVSPVPCYCVTNLHGSNCTPTSAIDSVAITDATGAVLLRNTGTGCTSVNGNAYTIYPASGSTTATLYHGRTYTLSIGTTGQGTAVAWLDLNRDGQFGTTIGATGAEAYFVMSNVTSGSTTFTIPSLPSTPNGLIGLRVRFVTGNTSITNFDACNTLTNGETEDYVVNIQRFVGTPEEMANAVEVYPNPSAGKFNVSIGQVAANAAIKVVNLQGQEVFAMKGNAQAKQVVDLTHLAAGMYVMQISLDGQVISKRIALQK